jgi:hypothetical protein
MAAAAAAAAAAEQPVILYHLYALDTCMCTWRASADGGKLLCDISKLPKPCVIYSLGSNGDYSFELDMLKVTQ